jgi:mannitol/fructose-specific phosphotransferase system IIA component (Ntr-type)
MYESDESGMAIPHPWKSYSDKDFVQKFWLENKITENQ